MIRLPSGTRQPDVGIWPDVAIEELARIHDAIPQLQDCAERCACRGAACSAQATLSQGPLQGVWIGDALLLARRVRVKEGTFLQGCWLDWDVIRAELLEHAADLLPGARLEPVSAQRRERARRGCSPRCRCGSSPARPDEPEPRWSPVRLSLLIAWACLGLAAAAIALVLHGALTLERAPGNFRLGRHARASHAAHDVSALHRDAR